MRMIAGALRCTVRNTQIVDSIRKTLVRCVLVTGLTIVIVVMRGLAFVVSNQLIVHCMRTTFIRSRMLMMATAPKYRVRRKRDESQYVSEVGEH